METVFLYLGKVIVCSGVMFLYYQLSLKDKTFHHYNRFYLLFAMIVSLLLPLIRVDDFTIEVNSDMYMLLDKIQNFNTEKNLDNGHIYFRIIFSALGLVSLYFLGKLIFGILKIRKLKKQFQKESFDGINFYRTDLTEAPFSYFKNLFWKNTIMLNSDVGEQILKHEMVHIEQKHSFDKIFIEIITSVFWFNPFFHIIKKEISLIHEYLADKKAVKQSDTKAFAQMLLASHFSGTQLPAASPFLNSNLKKRLKMLQKPKTKFGYARRIFALPVLFSVAFAYMVNAKNKEIKETNLSIKNVVSEIKKDTIRPEKTTGLKTVSPADHTKLAEIEKKLKEKEKELEGLEPESDAFDKKIEEISNLASEIGEMSADVEVDKYFNSAEWKNQMKELENMDPLDKKELRKIEKEAKRAARKASKISKLPVPPTPPKEPRVVYFKNNNTVNYNDLSPKEKEEVRKVMAEAGKAMKVAAKARIEGEKARIEGMKAGEIGRIAGERARIEGEKARIDGEKARKIGEEARQEALKRISEGARGNVYFFKSSGSDKPFPISRTMELQADYIKKDAAGNIAVNGVKKFKINNDWDDIKVFVDGKEVSKTEFEAIKPDKIASFTVNKENTYGVKRGEIRVQTKK
ncbi:antirepressor [Chryseobacterium sp. BLS98]|uniref:M56 family metallopeptidase n=1 Tax=Chryseobacterium sp. BLS98 TaxID=885586 RepID=UPI00065ADB89|nr:M56 family metallopeptidase [Chryseobacterium sp. BLS98]KMQ59091.1 antirepressor [Chryseobacterium sp. BLS98]